MRPGRRGHHRRATSRRPVDGGRARDGDQPSADADPGGAGRRGSHRSRSARVSRRRSRRGGSRVRRDRRGRGQRGRGPRGAGARRLDQRRRRSGALHVHPAGARSPRRSHCRRRDRRLEPRPRPRDPRGARDLPDRRLRDPGRDRGRGPARSAGGGTAGDRRRLAARARPGGSTAHRRTGPRRCQAAFARAARSGIVTVGTVALVGAGPGDPGLMTVRGLELLRRAAVVVYDRLVDPRLLDEAPRARRIFAGKASGNHALPQERINALLILHARRGRRVVRLKGGDPFVFGRGGEEAEALARARIPFEVVPGVSAAVAVPAYAGIPVTHRGVASSFTVVTGHASASGRESKVDWARLARSADTLVVLMGVESLPRITRELIAHGRPATTPVALVRWGTTSAQETVTGTLRDIAARAARARLEPPVVIVIGAVVALRDRLQWFDDNVMEVAQ